MIEMQKYTPRLVKSPRGHVERPHFVHGGRVWVGSPEDDLRLRLRDLKISKNFKVKKINFRVKYDKNRW